MTQDRTRAADEKFCGACAKIINKAAVACPNCGAPQDNSAPSQTTASSPPAQPASVNVNVNQNTNQNTDVDNPKDQSQRVILGTGEQHCSSCGSPVKIAAEICPSCGVRQSPPSGTIPTSYVRVKDKWIAVLLALLLGGIGVHKFYLGKPAQGFIMLALCWTTIPYFWGLIEGVRYILASEKDFSERFAGRR